MQSKWGVYPWRYDNSQCCVELCQNDFHMFDQDLYHFDHTSFLLVCNRILLMITKLH